MKIIKHLSFRIDEELLRQFQFVADHEGRSSNGQLLYLVRKCIAEYDSKHGKIELKQDNK